MMDFGAATLPDRFWSKAIPEPNSGCWLWLGGVNNQGYGLIHNVDRMSLAHRFAFLATAPIPVGLEIDHKCRNSRCVNPAHLEPVTHKVNMERAGKTHCHRGHALTPENRSTRRGRNGDCLACCRIRDRARVPRKRR